MSDTRELALIIVTQEDKMVKLDKEIVKLGKENYDLKVDKFHAECSDRYIADLESDNKKLKASNDAMNGTISIIERHCDLAKVSHEHNPADMKVEHLAKSYNGNVKRAYLFEAKASKLNAEKLAYMRIVKEVLTDCTEIVDIEDKYKKYLAGVKK